MYRIILISLIFIYTAGYTPPPPAPNYCSEKYCIELLPSENISVGFVRPIIKNYTFDDISILIANYRDIGSITVTGPFYVYKQKSFQKIKKVDGLLIANDCKYGIPKGQNREVCGQYIITTNQYGDSTKPLLCLVLSIWEKNGEITPSLATIRIDLDKNINSHCLNKN